MIRTILTTIILSIATITLAGCGSSNGDSMHTSTDTGDRMTGNTGDASGNTVVMTVHGMSCPLCATNIDKQLLKVKGVHSVDVDMSTGRVTMAVSEISPPSDAELARAVEESGFTLAEPPRRQ